MSILLRKYLQKLIFTIRLCKSKDSSPQAPINHQHGKSTNMEVNTTELLKLKAYLIKELLNNRLAVHTKEVLDMLNKGLLENKSGLDN